MTNAAGRAAETPSPKPLIAPGSWKGVLGTHPCLLGPREHLRELARTKPEMYAEIKTLDSLLACGIVEAVEGADDAKVKKHIDTAVANLARGVTNVHQDTWIWMMQVALAYDFFHSRLDEGLRRRMIVFLNQHRSIFKDDENAFHNSTSAKIFIYLQIAYATWAENPEAGEFRSYAIEKLYEGRVVPVLRAFGSGGGYTECGWYCRGSLFMLVEALELARRVEGYDGFAKAPAFFYNRLAYEIHQPYPGTWMGGRERYACEGDGHSGYSQAMEGPRQMRNIIAQYFRGSELSRYIAAKARPAFREDFRLYDFLYQEKADEALPLDGFPLAHCAAGIGKVFARSHWGDDATWLRFECGPFWNQHQHQEAGNFEIFRHEPLATESGEYIDWYSRHALNWLVRSIAHNCILIHQPGETFKNIRNWKGIELANDGGQGNNVYINATLPEWLANKADHERGQLVAYDNRPELLYVAGDCTKAYAVSKAKLVLRRIVFIRPHTFVILDRATSTRPEYEKTWLLHCRNEPAVEGAKFTVTEGKGRLVGRTLLPAKAVIRKVYGYTYGGETYDPENDKLSDTAVKWRIEVQPSEPRTDDVFLHVLSTDDAPPEAVLIRKDGMVGASAGRPDADGWEVLFDDNGGGRVTIGGRTFTFSNEMKLGKYEK